MQAQVTDIRKLVPNKGQIAGVPANPRFIRDERFDKLKQSLRDDPEMMALREIIAYDNGNGELVVVMGNMRYRAAKDLKMWEQPVKVLPKSTPPEKLRAYIIKDNVPFGETDWDMMANEWDIGELESWGMELPTEWYKEEDAAQEAKDDGFTEEEAVNAVTRVKPGEIWRLGAHRLMCGDSTDPGAVSTLMGGCRADACFSSPPYNAAVSNTSGLGDLGGRSPYTGGSYSDCLCDEDYARLLCGALGNALSHCDDVLFNIGILKGSKYGIIEMLHKYAGNFCDVVVWNKKNSLPMGLPVQKKCLSHRCELVFCFNRDGSRSFSHPTWKQGAGVNVIETENASANKEQSHHATFPVSFAAAVIGMFTHSSVLDLFCGTGTTIVAAEQLGRRCYAMEIDPHYCDVIIARWEKLTGGIASRIG